MDLLGLIRELSGNGISDVVLLIGLPLWVRHLIIQSRTEQGKETRQEIRDALDEKSKEIYRYIDSKFEAQGTRLDKIDERFDAQEARIDQLDRKNDQRAYDLTMHLIDVRERLANIEDRMGIYPPRRGVEPPTPEPAEAPESGEPEQS